MADVPAAAILGSARDAVIAFTPDGIINLCNPAAAALYGYNLRDMMGRPRALLLPSESREPEDFLSQSEGFQTTRVKSDGSLLSLYVRISPVFAGSLLIGFSEIACAIPHALDRELAHLAALVYHSEDAIIAKSTPDGVIQSWNAAAERIYGYSASEVVGQTIFTLLPKALLQQERELLAKVARGENVQLLDAIRVHKEGHPVHVSLTVSPIRDLNGEVIGASHVARDISETRLLKNKLQVSQKMEALGRLAGGVAHDFNNLLTVIRGYGALLQSSLKDVPALQEMADEVMAASDKAAELTRQLLTFSRNQVVHLQPVDLNDCLSKSLGLLRRLIGPQITIETSLTAGKAIVLSDAGQLAQVMMNLAANARDAMPEGGVIRISTTRHSAEDNERNRRLDLAPGNYIKLCFTDTGKGMDHETRSRIFEPFFTTKDLGKGTGLGLATVYGIVKQSNGQIFVDSTLDCGTTFDIYFPSAVGEPEVQKAFDARSVSGSETILFVEDEPKIRKLAVTVLRAYGYQVLSATNADEAFLQANSFAGPIPLLVTDVLMPGQNGQELASQLMGQYPEMRVIFISGFTEHAVMKQILSEPAAEFLPKPFTPDQLLKKVREVLD